MIDYLWNIYYNLCFIPSLFIGLLVGTLYRKAWLGYVIFLFASVVLLTTCLMLGLGIILALQNSIN